MHTNIYMPLLCNSSSLGSLAFHFLFTIFFFPFPSLFHSCLSFFPLFRLLSPRHPIWWFSSKNPEFCFLYSLSSIGTQAAQLFLLFSDVISYPHYRCLFSSFFAFFHFRSHSLLLFLPNDIPTSKGKGKNAITTKLSLSSNELIVSLLGTPFRFPLFALLCEAGHWRSQTRPWRWQVSVAV